MANPPNLVEDDFIEGVPAEGDEGDEGAGQQAAAATAPQAGVVPTNDPNMSVDDKLSLILATMATNFDTLKRDMATKEEMSTNFDTLKRDMATKAEMATNFDTLKRDMATKEEMATNFDTLKRDMATKADMALVSKNVEKLMVAAPAAALPANTS